MEGALAPQAALPVAGRSAAGRAGALYVAFNRERSGGAARLGDPGGHRHRLLAGVLAPWAAAFRWPSRCSCALAIIDDLGAILIIAIFYTDQLSALSLALAGLFITGLAILNVTGVRRLALYLVLGACSGCRAEVGRARDAGGRRGRMLMPLKPASEAEQPAGHPPEHAIKPGRPGHHACLRLRQAGVPLAGVAGEPHGTGAARHHGRAVPRQADRRMFGAGRDQAGRRARPAVGSWARCTAWRSWAASASP